MFKIYQRYLIINFLKKFLNISAIFLLLIFILSVLEEISFFKDLNINFYYPYFLTFLNTPITLFEIFPFIFLITTQFFFIKLIEQNENISFKNFGLSNSKIIKLLAILSFLIGVIIVTIFYNLSSNH